MMHTVGWQLRGFTLALVLFHSSEFMLAIFYGRCAGVQCEFQSAPLCSAPAALLKIVVVRAPVEMVHSKFRPVSKFLRISWLWRNLDTVGNVFPHNSRPTDCLEAQMS